MGAVEVNPLKFMPTVEDALAVMLSPRGSAVHRCRGARSPARCATSPRTRSPPGAASRRRCAGWSTGSIRSCSRRSWRRLGLLETLLAGGRRAKLWELYEKRYREIAESAETRFLGEVGADFRDAYETEEK